MAKAKTPAEIAKNIKTLQKKLQELKATDKKVKKKETVVKKKIAKKKVAKKKAVRRVTEKAVKKTRKRYVFSKAFHLNYFYFLIW